MAQNQGIQAARIFQALSPEGREDRKKTLLDQAVNLVRSADLQLKLRRLREILTLNEKEAVLTALKSEGVTLDEDFVAQDIVAIQRAVEALVHEIERRAQVPGLTTDFNARLTTALFPVESRSRENDVAPDDPRLSKLKADFDKGLFVLEEKNVKPGPEESPIETLKRKQPNKSNLLWEDVVERLNMPHWKNKEKTGLELALAMQDGGELMGVDKAGRLIIKDRGREPQFCRGKDYWTTYEAVYGSEDKPSGYELFQQGDNLYNKPAPINVFEKVRSHFIEGIGMNECSTWLDNGRDSEKSLSVVQTLDARKTIMPRGESAYSTHIGTQIVPNNPSEEKVTRGAIRLLKV